jgi:hypothetical protein
MNAEQPVEAGQELRCRSASGYLAGNLVNFLQSPLIKTLPLLQPLGERRAVGHGDEHGVLIGLNLQQQIGYLGCRGTGRAPRFLPGVTDGCYTDVRLLAAATSSEFANGTMRPLASPLPGTVRNQPGSDDRGTSGAFESR